jgi:predicted acyl esterase
VSQIRIYLPEEERDAPVVICSELPKNEDSSVTYSARQIAAEVIRYHRLFLHPYG